ncbi:MAG: IS1380 family transposase [Magnetococcales bacterium]|nr:IS1380 family transposase [Magnetococcales bacterium]
MEKVLKKSMPLRHGISHNDIIKSYFGLICQGKSDFEAIAQHRKDDFFMKSLGIDKVPSAARLRQRMDEGATVWTPMIQNISVDFLQEAGVMVTPLATGHVAIDMDVFSMDNSGTKKSGVSRTYMGYDGYAPIVAYLGEEGWCLETEFREGSQHSQKNFPAFFERVIQKAKRLTKEPLLARLDSAHDAVENRIKAKTLEVDFIIKWNPRQADPQEWLARANMEGQWKEIRPGKRISVFSVFEEPVVNGRAYCFRRIMRITERTIDKAGQGLLIPEITIEGWGTSLDLPEDEIIKLYEDHGTSEQFHSEFKTDLDLERLPSGKFETNALIMTMAGFAYNVLRLIGQLGLIGKDEGAHHPQDEGANF